MTLAEFKAWFEGFTEGMDSTPNAKQWDRIKARVKEIDGASVTREIYVDRYVRERPWYPYWATWNSCNAIATAAATPAKAEWVMNLGEGRANVGCWDNTAAMFALGKADAEDVAA